MKKYTRDELNEAVRLHKMWLRDEAGGVIAKLSGADLSGAKLYVADLSGADLSGADLSGADLSGSDLSGAKLSGADLSGAKLYWANLTGANLTGAKLHRANLSGAKLHRANLSGAKLHRAILDVVGEVKTFKYFSGLYKYVCMAIISDDGTPWVRMGCHYKPLSEWESLGIRNVNTSEFPHGTPKSERRARAYEFCKAEVLAMVAEMEGVKA